MTAGNNISKSEIKMEIVTNKAVKLLKIKVCYFWETFKAVNTLKMSDLAQESRQTIDDNYLKLLVGPHADGR